MATEPEPGINVPETTVAYDQFRLDPNNYTDDKHEPSPVWAASQNLRELVERADPQPSEKDRELLAEQLQRQLRTLGLLREVTKLFLNADPQTGRKISLFVLLFPGEARDNTGIKDLNDKVLGYERNNAYVRARQDAIKGIFKGPGSGPGYVTVGQDYKTAFIVARGKTPQDFKADLERLDAKLRELLLAALDDAAKHETDPKRLEAIRKLQATLNKDKNYRFDILYGMNSAEVQGKPLNIVFSLITEALKGAGMARFAVKVSNVGKVARGLGQGRVPAKVPKGHDPRGREFDLTTFLNTARAAEDIKAFMVKKPNRDSSLDFNSIFVNTVWTVAFLLVGSLYAGNPDVIRDVRKKALVPPDLPNIKFTFQAQVDLLEMWLVALNLIDFVKDFTADEAFGPPMDRYHLFCLLALEQLEDPSKPKVDWPRLAKLLTRDVRQGPDPIAVLGTASEFQFYAFTSDFQDQIILTFDVRDLGVDLMAHYEMATRDIVKHNLGGFGLLRRTFDSTDLTVLRKRFTHSAVIDAFRKYHGRLDGDAKGQAQKAFGVAHAASDKWPAFPQSIQVMLGGDEVFVAAHPLYAAHVHDVIRDLDRTFFAPEIPLNMRAGVAFSSAKSARGRGSSQRLENQIAHDKAMKLAGDAPGMLKQLERLQRRIELLIDKLEKNDKKKDKVPGYRKQLADLRLKELFARAKFLHAQPLSDATYGLLRKKLKEEDLAGAIATGLFDLVDFDGNEVDGRKLIPKIKALEDAVRKDVGRDNIHVDPPPVTKLPKWMSKLINCWADHPDRVIDCFLGDKPDDDKKKKAVDVRTA